MMFVTRRGFGTSQVLITTGRRSGEDRSVPVSPIVVEGIEYVVSPYGEVGWVRNVRAQPLASLQHGKTRRRVSLEEVTGRAAGIVFAYHQRESYARRFMEVPEDPTLADFESAADSFPVFRVSEIRSL